MAERKTFQKNIRFNEENKETIINKLKNRNKSMFPLEGDLINHLIVEATQFVGVVDPYYMENICGGRALIKHGSDHICSMGGPVSNWDKNKSPSIFKVGKDPMSIPGIIKICSDCYYATSSISDEDFDKICCQHWLIKEGNCFICTHGGPRYSHKKEGGKPFAFRMKGRDLPIEIVNRICNGGCQFTNMFAY